MINKILLISPTPTHPTTSGNRAAILSLAKDLINKGKEVHFFYVPFEDANTEEMKKFFNNNFYSFDNSNLHILPPSYQYYIKRIKQKIFSARVKIAKASKISLSDELIYNRNIDGHLSTYVRRFTNTLATSQSFDAVICEYVWMSKLLTYFPSTTYKIIDTHDRFTNRFKVFQAMGSKPEWFSLFEKDEAKGLKRANLLLAFNRTEKEFFEKISGVKTILRLPLVQKTLPVKKPFNFTLLYLASDHAINVKSINWFLLEVFPLVLMEVPEANLIIGGKICRSIQKIPDKVTLIGEIEDVVDFYVLGDIAINPELQGTGFKIKTFEALELGIPVVCSTAGASGLLEFLDDQLVLANSPSEFSQAIIRLMRDHSFRSQLSIKASKWATNFREKINSDLFNILKLQ